MARPITYKKIYATKRLEEYLETCKDVEEQEIVQENGGKKNGDKKYAMYKTVLKVKLPSIEGYAEFLGHPRITLYLWKKVYPEFEIALDTIESVQKQRLVERGLEGKYNSAIARLILSTNHGMHESSDVTSKGESINAFTDEQIGKIADRITRRRTSAGNTSGK